MSRVEPGERKAVGQRPESEAGMENADHGGLIGLGRALGFFQMT